MQFLVLEGHHFKIDFDIFNNFFELFALFSESLDGLLGLLEERGIVLILGDGLFFGEGESVEEPVDEFEGDSGFSSSADHLSKVKEALTEGNQHHWLNYLLSIEKL